MKYIVISPVRNEERYIEETLRSLANQTIIPEAWVIVDDGSTDRTADIVGDYAQRYNFIKLIRKEACPESKQAGYIGLNHAAELKAFKFALAQIKDIDIDYISKVDGDVTFGKDYFERLLGEFERDRRLGIASGGIVNLTMGRWKPEKIDSSSIVHAACVYRRRCLEDISPLTETMCWDMIEELQAQMKGWRTRNFDDIKVFHWRLMGSVGGILSGKTRHGYSAYLVGYHPLYMLARSIRRMVDEPLIVGGLCMLWGFCLGYIKRNKQLSDPETKKYLRSKQMKSLFGRILMR